MYTTKPWSSKRSKKPKVFTTEERMNEATHLQGCDDHGPTEVHSLALFLAGHYARTSAAGPSGIYDLVSRKVSMLKGKRAKMFLPKKKQIR